MPKFFTKHKTLLFLLIILAVASFFRLWELDSIPLGLYPDEAINGNEAVSSPGKVFYPENNGREGLFINLIFLSFSIFGISIWSLKMVAAIIGILTVFGLYLLTRELFNKNIALLSSFFLAISFWHVNFSRIGFRGILLPFILVFAFYFLFRAFRTQKIWDFIISGLFFGLGFYTYISYRFVVLLLPIILICWFFNYREQNLQKQFLFSIFYFLFFIFIIALPIGIYFLQNPGDFISRVTGISIFAQASPLKAFGESLIKHLGMFNFYGDPNWRHNFSGFPMLFWLVGILFLFGSFFSIKELIKSLKAKNFLILNSYFLLLVWFFIMLLPGILTYEGIPHALRTIGVIPVVYIFTGLGGWSLYQWLKKIIRNKKLLILLCLLFFISVTYAQFYKYFLNWAQKSEVANAFSKNYVEIGNYLNSLPSEAQKYVIVNQPGVSVPYPDGLPMPAQTVMFVERTKFGSPQSTYLLPEDLNQIKVKGKKIIIIPMKYEKALIDKIQKMFPEAEIMILM